MGRKLGKKNLNSLEEESRADSQKTFSKFTKSSLGSRIHSNKTLTKTDLKRFFSKDKNSDYGQSSSKKNLKPKSKSIFRKTKYITKPDLGNPRYAASKNGSMIGLLVG